MTESLEALIVDLLSPTYRFCQSQAVTARARGWNDRPWLDVLLNLDALPAELLALLSDPGPASVGAEGQASETVHPARTLLGQVRMLTKELEGPLRMVTNVDMHNRLTELADATIPPTVPTDEAEVES
jgi:hypothetical protein